MVTSNQARPEPESTLTVEMVEHMVALVAQMREAMAVNQRYMQQTQELRRVYDERRARQEYLREWSAPDDQPGAHSKSIALLKGWLSPDQLAQFDKDGFFEVTGSKSGKRYRIRQGRAQNVFRLEDDREMHGLCFVPDPLRTRAVGDVMLAQKIALETDEAGALKVAQMFPVYQAAGNPNPGGLFGGQLF